MRGVCDEGIGAMFEEVIEGGVEMFSAQLHEIVWGCMRGFSATVVVERHQRKGEEQYHISICSSDWLAI